jgi:nitrile hydratase subunit beta
MDGFGGIHRENDEPVFHEPWEARVFGMVLIGAGLPPMPVDAFRHRGEQLDPVKYLASSYYERWLTGLEVALVEAGALSPDEIEAKVQQFTADPDSPVPRHEDPSTADSIARSLRAGNPVTRNIRQKPRFAAGDRVVTRNLNPHGHTRLPRYARVRHGVVVVHHGAHVFPDTNAHGLGENPQHLYTVRFRARELWGNSAEPNQSVLIDLWESYLERDKAAGISGEPASKVTRRKSVAKDPRQPAKLRERSTASKRSLASASASFKTEAAGGRAKSRANGTDATGGRHSTRNKGRSGKTIRRTR